jgi:hypothetical protein
VRAAGDREARAKIRVRGKRGGGVEEPDANRAGKKVAVRIFAPGARIDGNLPHMSSCFANLLEAVFSDFGKIRRMPNLYTKLLELLLANIMQKHDVYMVNSCRENHMRQSTIFTIINDQRSSSLLG